MSLKTSFNNNQNNFGLNVIRLFYFLALLAISFPTIAASFDCDKAQSKVEKLICANPKISELDTLLEKTYTNIRESIDSTQDQKLIATQRNWLKTIRNHCPDIACLTKTYQARIDELDPFADNILTCDKMKKYPNKIFIWGIDLGSGFGSPIEVDYHCPESVASLPFMNKILELTETIRSEDGPQTCTGSIVYAHWRYYYFDLAAAGFAPKIFQEQTGGEQIDRPVSAYFKQWSELSANNFQLYQSFSKEFDIDVIKLADYYHTKFTIPSLEAKGIAQKAMFVVLDRAAGSFAHEDFKPSSTIALMASDPHTTSKDIRSIFADNGQSFSQADVYKALQIALLNNRPFEYIELFANKITPEEFQEFESKDEALLSFAIQNSQYLQLLIARGIPVNSENDFGKTALFYAIALNNHESVDMLLKNKADVNHAYKSSSELRPDNGYASECIYPNLLHTRRTPLMHAAQNSDVDMIKLLLKYGANLNDADDLGFNALDYASMGHNKENEMFLKQMGLEYAGSIKN